MRANVPVARTAAGAPDLDRTAAALPAYAAAGVTIAAFPLPALAARPADLTPERLRRLAEL